MKNLQQIEYRVAYSEFFPHCDAMLQILQKHLDDADNLAVEKNVVDEVRRYVDPTYFL